MSTFLSTFLTTMGGCMIFLTIMQLPPSDLPGLLLGVLLLVAGIAMLYKEDTHEQDRP